MTNAKKKDEPTKVRIQLKPRLIKAVVPAMSTEAARYYLNGIHLAERNGKLIYEATDGHRLMRVIDKSVDVPKGFEFVMKAETVKHLVSNYAKARDNYSFETTIEGQNMSVEVEMGFYSAEAVDCTYPDTDRVVPVGSGESGEVGVNAKYLADMFKGMKEICCKKSHAMKIILGDDNSSPVRFEVTSLDYGVEWIGVLMPLRI